MDNHQAGDFVSVDNVVVCTLGSLTTGCIWKGDNNRFHGEIIFDDAGTGVILFEEEVSIGAGKTVMAKTNFEE